MKSCATVMEFVELEQTWALINYSKRKKTKREKSNGQYFMLCRALFLFLSMMKSIRLRAIRNARAWWKVLKYRENNCVRSSNQSIESIRNESNE